MQKVGDKTWTNRKKKSFWPLTLKSKFKSIWEGDKMSISINVFVPTLTIHQSCADGVYSMNGPDGTGSSEQEYHSSLTKIKSRLYATHPNMNAAIKCLLNPADQMIWPIIHHEVNIQWLQLVYIYQSCEYHFGFHFGQAFKIKSFGWFRVSTKLFGITFLGKYKNNIFIYM